MNRYGKDAAVAEQEFQSLAREIKCTHSARMRLGLRKSASLRRNLRGLARLRGGEDVRRLQAESIHLQELLQMLRSMPGRRLPADDGGPRLLQLANRLAAGGEARIQAEDIISAAYAFTRVQEMQMREIQALPDAMRIALCVALAGLAGEMLAFCREEERAEKWVRSDGRRMLPRRPKPAFCARGLKLAAEMEKPHLHARLERRMDRLGECCEGMVEQAHSLAADHRLRLDNLLLLRRLLDQMDWEDCFARISIADQELHEDPAQVYGRMDDASRASVRECAADLARELQLDELSVVRYALRKARNALADHGGNDPRSTVCWYLAEDAGRRQLCGVLGGKRISNRIPDASGRRTAVLMLGSAAAAAGLLAGMMGNPWLMIYALPIGWVLGVQVVGKIYPRCVKPRRILKLQLDHVPENARTLVVLPVLLASREHARNMLRRMETLGCLERDSNIDFLLLGDFRDADTDVLPEDNAILSCVRSGVDRLNAQGRKKYFYLHRGRSYRGADARWMGKNRKRGALMALNALLLGRSGAEEAFGADGRDAKMLAGRYRYVVTLDADTEYLPRTIRKLVGAMLHPLNRACILAGRRRGFAVLQPSMLLTADACANAFVRRRFGEGGVDAYPLMISDFYQDMTGQGCFAGKGIYDVQAFTLANENVLDDDRILSHDLIEGILAGCGSLNDVFFYDGCPEDMDGEMARLHRWTRGDWQLLPLIFSGLGMNAVDRIKLLGNLLRSLYAPALLGLLVHAAWLDAPFAFAAGLLAAFHGAILYPGRSAWRCSLLNLAILPAQAYCAMDAVLRTLWRLFVSGKHLMDWVPSADAGKAGKKGPDAGKMAAILLLPCLLRPFWIAPAAALAALFWIGADWAGDLAHAPRMEGKPLSGEQAAFLVDIARRTWHFFDVHVPLDGCALPPDNVQIDPPLGAAMRTSPTNIGLYLLSCLGAWRLGFIRENEMLQRMEKTISAIEKLEKWNGHLYNWYDLNSLQPLHPRYVSSVDSGNLAGALLACAHAAENDALRGRMQKLAEEMNLAALFDDEKKLFFIGMDTETNRISRNHYDLYASESRILSYCAMMLGQVPLQHWKHLGRTFVRCGSRQALLSWSGTMFETLMPELLLRCPEHTLAGQNRRGMVACQMDHGRETGRPWGISESGHHAFDAQLNYQYRAFGLKALAMDPNAAQDVAAPYASALALMVEPFAAAENLRRMCSLGWMGEMGMYEAADYRDGERPRIVRSHMAHHQGMILCAICNALGNDFLSRTFMDIPQARALRLLLQEKPQRTNAIRRRRENHAGADSRQRSDAGFMRRGRREGYASDSHLLHGGGTTALVHARGGVFAWKDGWQLNRFFGDIANPCEGMYVHVQDAESGDKCVLGDAGRVCLDAGEAVFHQKLGNADIRMRIVVSPEDGVLFQQMHLHNAGKTPCILEITGCMAVAMAAEKDMRAHPVFQNLFVESCQQEGVLVFRRRRREPGEAYPRMFYLLAGAEAAGYETSLEKLVGRRGGLGLSGGIAEALGNTEGDVLNPCAAIRCRIRLEPDGEHSVHFALGMEQEDALDACIRRNRLTSAPERALQLASGQMRQMMAHTGIDARMFHLLQRCCTLIFDSGMRSWHMDNADAYPAAKRNDLWQAGISGDLPVLLVELGDLTGLDCVRDAIRMHAFYRNMGVKMDLVIIDHHSCDYIRPTRGALSDLIASSHLNGSFSRSGGVYLLERQNLNSNSYAAIVRFSALQLDAQRDAVSQLEAMLAGLRLHPDDRQHTPMRPSPLPPGGKLQFFNGCGGFDSGAYEIHLEGGNLPPAPWCNVLAAENAGAIISERGGGFAWRGNSRQDRLTPFANNPLKEGWGWMFYLLDEQQGSYLRLLPGDAPMTDFRVRHAPGKSSWHAAAQDIDFVLKIYAEADGVRFDVTLENTGERLRHLRIAGLVNWLMGTDGGDAAMMRCWPRAGACFASGTAEGIGVFACDDPRAKNGCSRQRLLAGGDEMQPRGFAQLEKTSSGWTLHLPLLLAPGEKRTCRFLLGSAEDAASAYALARAFRNGEALRRSRWNWKDRLEKLQVETPDAAVNLLANGFLQAQVLNARILGRTGLYQGGGAYGFRDQLQDMLPMIHYAPEMVKNHLLKCAARQFEAGDVLHWWHDPYSGVRTRISDDLLFLPFVTAQYVRITGDAAVLQDHAPFLKDVEIPERKEDLYAEMQPTSHSADLHRHCMLALRRAARTGRHGLCNMGSGDWNDGMNRIGGESVWLSMFLAVCAEEYAHICPDREDRAWLLALNERLRAAIEENAWDGQWYLRAYAENGNKVGGRECRCCRIDLISQAWSVFAGMNPDRSRSAMDAAWQYLADEDLKLIRLLAPAFDGQDFDPGYIAAYPPGVRENGAQYTHAACWMLCALARQGDGERAHRALQMLLPVNHSASREAADIYRVEPYVMAADIYTHESHAGRGGWSWYTGSAAWMLLAIWKLLGFERRKNHVRLHAMLHRWPEVRVKIRHGLSGYTLICRQDVQEITLDGEKIQGDFIEMVDDGREHTALFPPRKSREEIQQA